MLRFIFPKNAVILNFLFHINPEKPEPVSRKKKKSVFMIRNVL